MLSTYAGGACNVSCSTEGTRKSQKSNAKYLGETKKNTTTFHHILDKTKDTFNEKDLSWHVYMQHETAFLEQ